MDENSVVKMWEEDIVIPTYAVGKPDLNPMFLEKRVYQGSSGKVYPHAVIDKIYDEKIDKKYKAVYLENEYLKIMILPELGGRIQRAFDKTNNYDFVYYNQVIKPALVGLAGPWISGGIEFNWPQHHRPSTFEPIDYCLQENADGSKTVWVSEIEKMFRTKGMAGFTLYPGKAYLEIKGKLYNRTSEPQTFLWWANPAVAVNDYTQSVFPPDVHAVFDHGKRDVSKFPIATGTYYKMDYSAGVDISRYKNIPVPTSYMAYHSDYNFVGGYDHNKEAGILHIADHHISPGKKQWTWGCGDFGKAWDRNLTDEDGPYIELMTGMYTDNQPDFSWIRPYEEKEFKQFFMPYKGVGVVKNSTIDVAVNLEISEGISRVAVYGTSIIEDVVIELTGLRKIYLNARTTISPTNVYDIKIKLEDNEKEKDLELKVSDKCGKLLISYRPGEKKNEQIPEAAKPVQMPLDIKTNEELYLTGLHLEQYRHATYDPVAYYTEGLKRDAGDIRISNAYGSLLFRRGQFIESETYFRNAIKTMTKFNPNPYDGEPYYNLGLSLKMQGRVDEAFDSFYKSIWNASMQDNGYYFLASIACQRGDYSEAIELVEKAIVRNYHNYKARNLKGIILRKMGKYEEAEKLAVESISIDPLEFGARNELYHVLKESTDTQAAKLILLELSSLMRNNSNSYIELSLEYCNCGCYEEAIDILSRLLEKDEPKEVLSPMVYYYLSYYNYKNKNITEAIKFGTMGMEARPDYCFPNKLEDILVLEQAIELNPKDSNAHYYLGNLLYDKKQYEKAIKNWESAVKINEAFPTAHRNLALAYFNKLKLYDKAKTSLEKAFELNQRDARVFLELDLLYKKLGMSQGERLDKFEKHLELVEIRDDLYVEYITLLNSRGMYEKALSLIESRRFHPWEGGEGKVTAQYVYSLVEIGKKYLENKEYSAAVETLLRATVYPHNLGEGKLAGAQENNINYFIGCGYEGLGEGRKAIEYFDKSAVGIDEPAGMMFYNDQPADMIFYQGLALNKLKKFDDAKKRFSKLISYGEKHISDNVTIDYFAVSLPDLLIFDEDLNRKNVVHCHYLMGLGYLGFNNLESANKEFDIVNTLDVNHLGMLTHVRMINLLEKGKFNL